MKRVLTAAIALPLLALLILKLPPVYYSALLALASAIALWEFYSMYRVKESLRYAGIILGILVIAVVYVTHNITSVIAVSVMAVAAIRLFVWKEPGSSLSDVAPVLFGLLYVPVMLGYQIFLIQAAPELLLFLMASVWTGDALALYVGKSVGRRKLYVTMSPNKTIAGGFGSLAGGALGAAAIKVLLIPYIAMKTALLIGVVVGGVAIVGDLVESMFKRDAGVKDSGSYLPGHGGILDKIDGSVFAGPVLYWIFSAIDVIR